MSEIRAQAPGNLAIGDLSFLLDGVSSTSLDLNSIEDAVRSLDVQLEENTSSLETSWVKFMDACNDIPQVSKSVSEWLNSEQAVELLTDPNFVQSSTCIPEPIAINCFLNNVIQALERNPGHEEMIFQDLVQFASEQGIMLPEAVPVQGETNEPPGGTSAHAADDDDKTTSSLWEIIRHKLRQGLFSSMGKLPLTTSPEAMLTSYAKQLDILQNLCFLFPSDVIWEGYRHQRQLQVKKLITHPEALRSLEVEFVVDVDGVPGDAIMLAKLSKAIAILIHEDYALIEEEFVHPKILTLEYIHETYLNQFTQELNTVLQAHTEELSREDSDSAKFVLTSKRRSSFRRGSGVSIFGDNLKMYKYCYLASLSLELAVVKLMEQQEARGLYDLSGIKSGHLSSVLPTHSPTSAPRIPTRVAAFSSSSTNMFASEDSLPPPFGHGPSHKQSTGHPSSSTSQSLGGQWPWRDEFKAFTNRISIAVADTIKKSCDAFIDEESQQYLNTKKLTAVYLKEELVGGKHDYPRCISKSCACVLGKADEVLPLASSHGGKVFHVVRSSFVDSLDVSMKACHSQLSQVASDFPKRCSADTVYLVLSNATFIRNHLAYYENVIGSEPRRPFPVLHKQFSDLVDSVTENVVNYHNQTIATVVFQDAHSHNWSDHRAFYEDERCSFSVQMWNYYLQGLRQDLWKYCPPLKAQEVFTTVLHSSLSTLTFRLSRLVPSYNRTKQFRSDITAILLCVLSHLWSASKSLGTVMDPASRTVPFTSIHDLCSCLLANMVVVTSPLETLCSALTGEQNENSKDKSSGSRTGWLSRIYPEVFRSHEGSIVALPDRQALYVAFKLMINQPVPRWPLVVQALLMRNARLPVIIVKYGDLSVFGSPSDDDNYQARHKIGMSWFENLVMSANDNTHGAGLVTSLYWLLYQCSRETTGLISFLMALVHREDSWKMFDSSGSLKVPTQTESPVWLNCIYETFDPILQRLLRPSLLMLCQQDMKVTKSYNFTSMSALPCGCSCKKPARTIEPKGQTEMVYQALQEFICHLTENVTALPKVICQFVNRLQETLHEKSIDVNGRTAGLKILASNIYRWLMDSDKLSDVCYVKPSTATHKSIEVFARVVWHVLVDLKQDAGNLDDPDLPTDLEFFINSKKEWLCSKVEQVKAYIANHSYEEFKVESVHKEVEDTKVANTASVLVKDPKSEHALKHVYRFLRYNKDWLMNFILVPGHILPPSPSANLVTSEQSSQFSPLRQHAMIGEWAFDQDKIASFPYDWEKLLQSDLGISDSTMQRLVFNRFEMQEGAYLDEKEKELVQVLMTYYGMSVGGEAESAQTP